MIERQPRSPCPAALPPRPLREIGVDQNTTVVFPMPIDLASSVIEAVRGATTGAAANNGEAGLAAADPPREVNPGPETPQLSEARDIGEAPAG